MGKPLRAMPASKQKRLCGLRLKAARRALGWDEDGIRGGKNQAAFYATFEYAKGRGNNWETGLNYPAPDFLIEFDERFGIDPGWILRGKYGVLPRERADEVLRHYRHLLREEGETP